MSDKVKDGIIKLIQHYIRPTDYHAMYPARVESQNDTDGTLNVVPDDSRLPGLTNVPIRYGLPGITAAVKKDSRVIIQFEGGSPQKPVATVWDSSSVEYIVVGAEKTYIGEKGDNVPAIARVGDPVQCLLPPVLPVVGTMSGAPFSGVLTIVDPVYGMIIGGSKKGYSK